MGLSLKDNSNVFLFEENILALSVLNVNCQKISCHQMFMHLRYRNNNRFIQIFLWGFIW